MRIKTTNEATFDSDRFSFAAKSRITNFTIINQCNGLVKIGMNTETPYLELGIGQSIAYDAGENSIWGDGFLKINYLASTTKQIIVLQTIDLGEL